MMSPTSRTLEWLREQGYTAAVTEHWNPHVGIRQDLFGCLDILAVCGPLTVGVQATSDNGGNMSARVKKIHGLPGAKAWLTGDTRQLWVVAWRQHMKAENGKKWRCRVIDVRLEDLEEAADGQAVTVDS